MRFVELPTRDVVILHAFIGIPGYSAACICADEMAEQMAVRMSTPAINFSHFAIPAYEQDLRGERVAGRVASPHSLFSPPSVPVSSLHILSLRCAFVACRVSVY